MAATSAKPFGSSGTHIVHRGESEIGPFMLTLCRLVEPVCIRPPQSPRLKPFTFFTSRERQWDGCDRLYLHMGFFETMAYAQRWAQAVRNRHPDALVTATPAAFLRKGSSGSRQVAPAGDRPSLTDTQVLDILEMRRPAVEQNEGDDRSSELIELVRPDDTGTRRALKEAVACGAPVFFAVQLHWSTRPIDPSSVPAIALLKAHALYVVESRHADHSCYFLRLGFFGDPVSARQIALQVRSSFASAAVVPVLDGEVARARAACIDTGALPCLVQQRVDQTPELGMTPVSAARPEPESGAHRGSSDSHGAETLEQTLARLAEREMLHDPDLLSDTGVRHLKFEVQARASGRRH